MLEGQGEGRHGGGEAEDVANMDAANEARRGPEDQSQRNQPISYSIAPALETHLRPSPKVFSLNTGLGTGASTEAAPTSDLEKNTAVTNSCSGRHRSQRGHDR